MFNVSQSCCHVVVSHEMDANQAERYTKDKWLT